MDKRKLLRIILICLAVAVLLIPILWVSITEIGFSVIVSHILLSVSIALLIGATALNIQKGDPKWIRKLCIIIVLIFILISLWT